MKTHPVIHPPKRLLLILLMLVLWAPFRGFACHIPAAPKGEPLKTSAAQTVTDASNQFGLDLYRKLVEDKSDKNQFFSPFSVFAALCMLSEGADGATLAEMRKAMHLPSDVVLHDGFKALGTALSPNGAPYALAVANAIWPDFSAKVHPQFLETIKATYHGESKGLDFVHKSEVARKVINDWVSGRTQGRIKDLLPAGSITAATRMVLTNAIYFKGKWKLAFDKKNTLDEPFTLVDGKKVVVPTMHLPAGDNTLHYAQIDGTQFLELPYQGDDLSMLVVLPENGKVRGLESKLDAREWADIRQRLAPNPVNVWLPRFKMNIAATLNEPLAGLGLGGIFGSADFSRMIPGEDLSVSDVFHKAFVEVNEEGTEAAAATAIVVRETAAALDTPPTIDFRADHPFLFVIQHRATGNILFMGKVMNPAV